MATSAGNDGECRNIVVIGANNDAAKKIITNIKTALTQNKALRDDFPEAIYPFYKLNGSALLARGQLYLGELTGIEWKPQSVVFANIPGSKASGATIYSVGIKGAIQDRRKLRRYRRRYKVERTNAWLKKFRRVAVRWDKNLLHTKDL